MIGEGKTDDGYSETDQEGNKKDDKLNDKQTERVDLSAFHFYIFPQCSYMFFYEAQ